MVRHLYTKELYEKKNTKKKSEKKVKKILRWLRIIKTQSNFLYEEEN